MSQRHLPAGQNKQGGGGPPVEMAGVQGNPSQRRRHPPPPYNPGHAYHHQPQQPMNPMYSGYNNSYGPQGYHGVPQYQNPQYPNAPYQGAHYPGPQYQGGGQYQHQYQHQHQPNPYVNNRYGNAQFPNGNMPPYNLPYGGYAQSPPPMHQYAPMVGVNVPSYGRPPQQQSPAHATPYQPPLGPMNAPVHASTQNSHIIPPPTPPTPQTQESFSTAPKVVSSSLVVPVQKSVSVSEPAPTVVPVQEHIPGAESTPAVVPAQESAPITEPAPADVPFREPTPVSEPAPESVTEQEPALGFEEAPSEVTFMMAGRVITKPSVRVWGGPSVPWLSCPDEPFPKRAKKAKGRKSRRRTPFDAKSAAVSLPVQQHEATTEEDEEAPVVVAEAAPVTPKAVASAQLEVASTVVSDAAPSTPKAMSPAQASTSPTVHSEVSSQAPGTEDPATPTTPSSVQRSGTIATPTTARKVPARAGAPAPVVPALPKASAKEALAARAKKQQQEREVTEPAVTSAAPSETAESAVETSSVTTEPPVAKAAPTSWANLFAKSASAAERRNGTAGVNGHGVDGATSGLNGSSGLSKTNSSSVAEAIQKYQVGASEKISFLEPRGLINTGNMCYMNSVLQVLMFCVPFFDFLIQTSKKAVHSFNSQTPMVDAMIMFMHEYKIIKSASSADSLRRSLKNEELERYGEPLAPEFVYEAIRQLPRFASMRRGHQQDAEEFLGFLLQSLDDECTSVMSNVVEQTSDRPASSGENADPSGDWLEVGRKQRAAVTRASGSNTSTPITKIFGGLLRSEFRVAGLKDSITTEPYQPLQLDIGSPDVRNIIDAIRNITRQERLQGDFGSPRGPDVPGIKQVFIEALPPVLILHLKRFQFDAEGHGTVKIWKKIGYPLELEIPKEVLSRQKRQALIDGGMTKYRLISVVYHHGKNASGGHYTVDVRRQDGQEWIRLDDTVIRRIRSEDVAQGGEEEGLKDPRKDGNAVGASGNRFGAINDEETGDDDGWKQVTASASGNKRWSSVVNGTGSGTASSSSKGKQTKDSIKDNKVAYLLFYQRV